MALKTVLKEIEANKTFGQPQDRNKYVYSKEQIFDWFQIVYKLQER